MNCVRTVTLQFLRRYGARRDTAGVRGKMQLDSAAKGEIESEEFVDDDLGAYESDFMNVGESYSAHQRESKEARERLKRQIVKSKYFKDVQPSFLTFIEKDQIRKLHNSNPEEWTVEKLSESFPALPETIQKILRTKWVPKSADRIIKYDTKIIENWKNFKKGNLVVDPMLSQHLMKFRNRRINLIDKELLAEQFIPPKMKFPKSRSTKFLEIVKNDIVDNDSNQSIPNEKLISSGDTVTKDEKNDVIVEQESVAMTPLQQNNLIQLKSGKQNKVQRKQEKLTLDDFLKEKLRKLYETSPEEGITLLDLYRKRTQSANSEDISMNVLKDAAKEIETEKKDIAVVEDSAHNSALTDTQNKNKCEIMSKMKNKDTSLDTYILERNILIDTQFEYIRNIRIPKNVYKEGMTYRVKDCYYDDDGEFLYRTPGLKS